jgi:hypothetical protein
MRTLSPLLSQILEMPEAPGNRNVATMVGDMKPTTRVTVEPSWSLGLSSTVPGTLGWWPTQKMPIRWFQRADNSQVEREIPNIKRVVIDRTLDQDAATMTMDMYNTIMDTGPDMPWYGGPELGQPGYFTFTRGYSADALSRWKQVPNTWSNVLMPNALLRVYQGYGGRDLDLKGPGGVGDGPAITQGYVIQTGTFLVDTVTINSGKQGPILSLHCRDTFKLLIDQMIYPPLVPSSQFPVFYQRHVPEEVVTNPTNPYVLAVYNAAWHPKRCVFYGTGNQAWVGPEGVEEGHHPGDSVDYNYSTFWLSVGNATGQAPAAVEWIEYDCEELMNGVYLYPWAGHYQCWVSVMEGGIWQGTATIPYTPGTTGRYIGSVYNAAIPYVLEFGTTWESGQWYQLPRLYQAQKVRFSFSNLVASPWGPNVYRAGLREVALGQNPIYGPSTISSTNYLGQGNYDDYIDVVRDFLLYAGFWLPDRVDPPQSYFAPIVWGNLEFTGAPGGNDAGPMTLDNAFFDKKPVIDVIKTLRDVVGYIFRADAQGAARLETPNWWQSGNFYDDGTYTSFIPVMDERTVLTDLAIAVSDAPLRSEVIATTQDPASPNVPYTGWPLARFSCGNVAWLRGMIKPAMIGPQNNTLTQATQADMEILAELVALQIWFQQRQAQVTCIFRPDIDIDTQVRVYDRVAGETFVHYVRGVHTEHDLDSGSHTMTLTTNWLGDRYSWAITSDPTSFGFALSQNLVAFLARQQSHKTDVFRAGARGL